MAQNPYAGYGGNPYEGQGGDLSTRTTVEDRSYNPYAPQQTSSSSYPTPQPTIAGPQYGQGQYGSDAVPQPPQQQQPSGILSEPEFLTKVDTIKADIRTLTTQISSIATAHQRAMSSTDSASTATLESLSVETRNLNKHIKEQIKLLEADAKRTAKQRRHTGDSSNNNAKDRQVKLLKSSFTQQLRDYEREEADYRARYREQIARQFRIVNPEASEAEVREAQDADWGNEGVFQTALRSNRGATASTVLSSVRARHADIARIERTMAELQTLFEQLAQEVEVQDTAVVEIEQGTTDVVKDTERANEQLGHAVVHALRTRRMKWICLGICVLIVLIVALVVGLVVGLNRH